MTFKAPNFTQSIFNHLSCTGTQWIGDKVIINSTTSWLHYFNKTADEQLFEHVQYSECAVFHIQRAVLSSFYLFVELGCAVLKTSPALY